MEHWAHKTERAAEALAVLTGLLLAALMGVAVRLTGFPSRVVGVIVPVLGIGLLGYVMAGVIGKVFAEIVIDALGPSAAGLRALASPLTFGLRQIEHLVECGFRPFRVGASAGPFAGRGPHRRRRRRRR